MKFGTDTHHLHDLLELVHVNVCGPTKTASLESHWYFVSVVDDYSKRCWVYPMRQRVETQVVGKVKESDGKSDK